MCSYGFDDYIYMAAVPFNNNDIFMKQLNSIAIIIGQNKIAWLFKVCSNKNRPATYLPTVMDYSISECKLWKHNWSYDNCNI